MSDGTINIIKILNDFPERYIRRDTQGIESSKRDS